MQPKTEAEDKRTQMLARERHREILDRVAEVGGVRVAALAEQLCVTPETIRRDLEKLGSEGKLIRIHGGAMPIGNDRRELPLDVRGTVNLAQKRTIARYALRYVSHGDVIALDASSTAREMARVLPDIPLTVVTNSIAVATALAERPEVRVVSTGGLLDGPSLSYVGPIAEESLARFHIKKAFISCQGIDLERGLSVTADEHAGIKRRMIDLAEAAYLLADSTKFGRKAVEFFAPLSEIDAVITDAAVSSEVLRVFTETGHTVEVAP